MIEHFKKLILALYRFFRIGTMKDLNAIRIELDALKPALSKTQEDLAETRAELDALKPTLSKTQEELTQARAELDALKPALSKTQEDLAETRAELDALKPTLSKTQEELAQARAELESVKTNSVEIAKRSANLWYGLKNVLSEEKIKPDLNLDEFQELWEGIETLRRELEDGRREEGNN